MNKIEKKYVYDTYKKISHHFDTTRAYLWQSVKDFLEIIPENSIICEIGSGNGKNLQKKNCINLAFDLCPEFCKITKKKNIESIISNNLNIPLKTSSVDYVLSIAVIHHLSTHERRIKAIEELIRILKPNGKLLIQVWAFEQNKKSKNQFIKQENLVEFKNSQKTLNEMRYYYVFKKNELDNIIKNINNIKIIKSYWEMGNWVMIIEKFI